MHPRAPNCFFASLKDGKKYLNARGPSVFCCVKPQMQIRPRGRAHNARGFPPENKVHILRAKFMNRNFNRLVGPEKCIRLTCARI